MSQLIIFQSGGFTNHGISYRKYSPEELEEISKMKEFPIMTKKGKEYIPYDIIKPHEEQALKNHCGQTLDRLAARGGLSWSEAYAVLTDSKFTYRDQYISEEFYEKKVKEIVSNAKRGINMSKYCHSNDGELYYGEFDTEQDALEDAKESYPGESEIYIGTCTKPVFRWNGCEEKIIDSIKENLAEDVGEAAENFEVSVEQELELARMIDETVKAWIEQEEIEPSCYCVLDGHIVSLN